jgi:aryl sulfotransferase
MAEPLVTGRLDWLASYPKSGNTWMRLLLAAYAGTRKGQGDAISLVGTEDYAASRQRFDDAIGVSSADLTEAEVRSFQPDVYAQIAAQARAPLWMKVHDQQARLEDARWLFPPEASGVVIYLIRNPLDVAVSLAFHDGHEDMARAVAKLCDPAARLGSPHDRQLGQHIGDWSGHVISWVDQGDIPVLVVRYEDMLADAGAVLVRVLRFARPGDAIDGDRIRAAVRDTAFETLKAAEAASGFRETPLGAQQFFRAGRQGAWRDHLSPEQADHIRAHHLAVMRRFGYAEGQGA